MSLSLVFQQTHWLLTDEQKKNADFECGKQFNFLEIYLCGSDLIF